MFLDAWPRSPRAPVRNAASVQREARPGTADTRRSRWIALVVAALVSALFSVFLFVRVLPPTWPRARAATTRPVALTGPPAWKRSAGTAWRGVARYGAAR